MKTAQFAWFVNGLDNTSEQGIFTLPACTIRGYQMSISAGALDWTIWQGSTYAVFDFMALLSDNAGWPSNMHQVGMFDGSQRVGGTNPPPATDPPTGQPVLDGTIAAVYAIITEAAEHSNQSVVVPYGGLSVPVPANSFLYLRVGHSGGKGTFAVKLVLYYDEATP